MSTLLQDLRYGLRMLVKNPSFTAVAVLTLALGIGLNTSIFQLFDAIVLRPMPVKDPSAVVCVYQSIENEPGGYRSFSYPEYVALRDSNAVFSGLVAYSWMTVEFDACAACGHTVRTTEEAQEAQGQLVSDNYFTVLGGQAALGRRSRPTGSRPRVLTRWWF